MGRYYPVHLDLTGKLCLVVGGGPVAERKVRGLVEAGAKVRVVALAATEELYGLQAAATIQLILAPYDTTHLDGVCLAFAATDRPDVNARIAADAAQRNVWINRADAFADGDFIVPSVVRNGELCLSVSTGGNQPLLTARIASELQKRFGPDFADFVDLLGRMRAEIKARFGASNARREAMKILMEAEQPLREMLRAGENAAALAEARRLVDVFATSEAGVDADTGSKVSTMAPPWSIPAADTGR